MVNLVLMLQDSHQIVVLTGRPDIHRENTWALFVRMGFIPDDLVMYPSTDIPHATAAGWKYDVVKGWLDEGYPIVLAVEDYKPNADSLRNLVPVLLYERKKDTMSPPCGGCGGRDACWCARL